MLQGTWPEGRFGLGKFAALCTPPRPAPCQAPWTPHLDLSQLRAPAAVPHRQHVLVGIIHHTEESALILRTEDTPEGLSEAWRSWGSWSKGGEGCHDRLREQKVPRVS